MRRTAFTLIELLVVIAIIAILAAILFPVFAQAKVAAKKTNAISQLKNIGTAWQLYAAGYGYNWGPQIYAGGGVLDPEQQIAGGGTTQPGRALTSFDESANLFVFGDTYDTPRPTIGMYPNSAGGKAWILDTFNVTAGTRQRDFRWGGRFNMAYADGHAKNVQFKGGLTPGVGYVYVPSQPKDRVAYCANPSEMLDGSRFSLGMISCQNFVDYPFTVNTVWSPE
jgi:prepilin-type N-terminal cleavage/methylation domain-containing protein/prepilin-type processing-associated H-X9-DG protein